VGVDGVWSVGNHGMEQRDPSGDVSVNPDVLRFEPAVAEAVRRSAALAAQNPGVVVEDKRWTASVHYRLAHPSCVPALTDAVREMADALGLRLTHGKEVLELRPPVDIDKGVAALALAERLGATASGGSLFCAGDDRTDEDAFRVLREARPESVTVRVGAEAGRPTSDSAAEFYVTDTEAMRALLGAILQQRQAAA
jgi:trehalose-phosphatase